MFCCACELLPRKLQYLRSVGNNFSTCCLQSSLFKSLEVCCYQHWPCVQERREIIILSLIITLQFVTAETLEVCGLCCGSVGNEWLRWMTGWGRTKVWTVICWRVIGDTISLCPVAFRKEGIPLYYFGFFYFQTLPLHFMQGQKSWLCIKLSDVQDHTGFSWAFCIRFGYIRMDF